MALNDSWVGYSLTALMWATLVHRLRLVDWRPRDADAGERMVCASFFAFSLVFSLSLAPSQIWVNRLSGLPNFAELLITCGNVFGGWALQRYWAEEILQTPEVRRPLIRRAWPMVGVIGVITALYVLMLHAGVFQDNPAVVGNFTARYAAAPWVAEATLIFVGYMGLGACHLLRRSWRLAHIVDKPHLRPRAYCYTVGWALAVATNLHGGLYTSIRRLHLPFYPSPWPTAVGNLLLGGCIIMLLSPVLFNLHDWLQERRGLLHDLRQLDPLWQALCATMPQLAIAPGQTTLAETLYYRVIKTRDGIDMLQIYFDPAVIEYTQALCKDAETTGEKAQVTVEAATVGAALQAKQLDYPPARSAPRLPLPPDPSFEGELRYFQQVASAYQHSPIVACVLERDVLEQERAASAPVKRWAPDGIAIPLAPTEQRHQGGAGGG